MIVSRLFKKTLLIMVVLFGLLAAAISLFSAWTLYSHMRTEYESKALAIAESMSQSSAETFVNNQATRVQSLINQFLDVEGVAYVFATTEYGDVIAHTFVPAFPETFQEWLPRNLPRHSLGTAPQTASVDLGQRGRFLHIAAPILAGSAGYLHIGMSLGRINTLIWKAIGRIQVITFGLFVISVAVAYFLVNRIAHPLMALAQYSRRVARQDFEAEVDIRSNDEIGELAVTMRDMAAELQDHFRQLEEQITIRREAEEALAAEKELLAVTMRSIGDGVIATDIRGRVVLVNKVAEHLTGWSQEDALEQEVETVFALVSAIDGSSVPCPAKRALKHGEIFEIDDNVQLRQPSGLCIDIGDSAAPIRDRQSVIIGAVIVFRDIREEKRREQEHLRAEKLESLGVLAGGIAHDFNNILTAILNNITLARVGQRLDVAVASKLQDAERATQRAKKLTQQLLAFSQGGLPVTQCAPLDELLEDAISFALRGSNVCYRVDIPSDLWPVQVDTGQIAQVFDNLAINASQAMANGGQLDIWAENVPSAATFSSETQTSRGYVRVHFQDNGCGIPEADQGQIFDPYFTTKPEGSGLGLSSVFSIIKRHGGTIHVQSAEGRGTTFTLYLPAAEGRPDCATQAKDRPITGQGRILVMDDEKEVRDVLGDSLEYLGYEPSFAANGEQVLELYRQQLQAGAGFDAVIMDLTVPGGMGGKETIKHLHELDREVRAIVSSGYSQDPVMARYREYGFAGVLMKPYTLEEVGQKLRSVLQN
ncbi:ATP-binding protein [Desulfohalobium retbaense]|uniref:histidine kinase n=1 Tax=Desulfohalobium retbaense (strain ATCC 49708 / DSM 5692 / JCM 16813 / HR100) TaxID=485915 RepID=C8X2E7_DESRD|nr:ATP-binding protein [Desulfohalobium retbaense]ACV68594.1 PAS/PAC sensor hybrid histidine kinase [Desulfohalobium retbaense DSM 5692]